MAKCLQVAEMHTLTIVLAMFLTCQGFVLQHPIPLHITINGTYYVKLYNKVPLITMVTARIVLQHNAATPPPHHVHSMLQV